MQNSSESQPQGADGLESSFASAAGTGGCQTVLEQKIHWLAIFIGAVLAAQVLLILRLLHAITLHYCCIGSGPVQKF